MAVATSLQDKFSWTNVAAAGVGSAVGYLASDALGIRTADFARAGFAERLAKSALSGFAAGAAAAIARGGRVTVQQVAVDAFGNALGNSIAEYDWGGTAQQSASYSTDEQAQELVREETRFAQKPTASRDTDTTDLGTGLNPYRSSEPGLKITNRVNADWTEITNAGILQGADQLRALEKLARELSPKYPEYELLASNGNGPLVPKDRNQVLSSSEEVRDPTSLKSALYDTGKAVWNAGVGFVEGVPNLLSGAIPGAKDYVPFLDRYRAQYDTPAFGTTVEFLTGVGAFKVLGEISATRSASTTGSFAGQSIDDLAQAASATDRGELSIAGRALQKHGNREGSIFPSAQGNPAAVNTQAQEIVNEILNNPATTATQRNTGRFGQVTDIVAPDGRGLRYDANGKLIGFLEPPKK